MPKVYKLTETTTEATHYYLITPCNMAIPKTPDSVEVLNAILLQSKNFHLPQGLVDYPIITRAQLALFPDCIPVQVKVTYLKYKVMDKEESTLGLDPTIISTALNLRKVRPNA